MLGRALRGDRRALVFYGLLALGLIGLAWASRSNPGGATNVLLPAFALAAMLLAWVTGMYEPTRALLFRVDGAGHVGYTVLGLIIAFAPIGVLLFQGFARRQTAQSSTSSCC